MVLGSVYIDLLVYELICDLYVGVFEVELQWIGLVVWEYCVCFDVDVVMLFRFNVELCFDGLDIYVEVSFNGKLLLCVDNVYCMWCVWVEGCFCVSNNELQIVFCLLICVLLLGVQVMLYKIVGNYLLLYGDELKDVMVGNFVCKLVYYFGWDWGLCYVIVGVWCGIDLQVWDVYCLIDFVVCMDVLSVEQVKLVVLL